ncbi:MAG: type II secretion system protein GspK [Proteobacteria bacterium]|nr:type II secretion system protein GspK [Pseudomonadota bacterium]
MKIKPKNQYFSRPHMIWGFPVGEPRSDSESDLGNKRGIAMIVVMFMITLMALFSADMIVTSAVDAQLAAGNRDNIKAEYIAKSGANLASFLLMADLAFDLGQAEAMGANASVTDGPGDFWSMMNDFPIGADTLEMVSQMQETFDLSKVNDSAVMDQLKLFDGHFTFNISDESSKINVNYLSDNAGSVYQTMLKALMSCPAEKDYLERKKLNPAEIVALMKDWVDLNDRPTEETGRSSEDDPYTDRVPKVKAKNAPFDSLEELRMIPGWDADVHTIFSPFLTVFPLPVATQGTQKMPINFNSASREFLGCLFPKANTDCAEKSIGHFRDLEKNGPATSSEQIQEQLKSSFCAEGDEIAKKFSYRSDLYRIRVKAEVYGQTKSLEIVMQRKLPDNDDIKLQFKAAYRFLYWKML